jgi:hypothetical protein
MVEIEVHDKLAVLLSKPFEYADFSQLAARYVAPVLQVFKILLKYNSGKIMFYIKFHSIQLIKELSAFNLFVAWLKVYKYMSFNKIMATLTGTIAAVRSLVNFFLVDFQYITLVTTFLHQIIKINTPIIY